MNIATRDKPASHDYKTWQRFPTLSPNPDTFVDLFCGIGGFHLAAAAKGLQCVFACDIDRTAHEVYRNNFAMTPAGDITDIAATDIPDHDILFAGLPCQPFSIIGGMQGMADPRGTLFYDVERIVAEKKGFSRLRSEWCGWDSIGLVGMQRTPRGWSVKPGIVNVVVSGPFHSHRWKLLWVCCCLCRYKTAGPGTL